MSNLVTAQRITVVTHDRLEEMLVRQFAKLGAKGYTSMDCRGRGEHELIQDVFSGATRVRIETVVQPSVAEEITASKQRVRGEKFADHYSQAQQFFISQTEPEQTHIKDAFVFELSKCENPAIRTRMVSHLMNVDSELATKVANGLGLKDMPKAAEPARKPISDLPASPPGRPSLCADRHIPVSKYHRKWQQNGLS